MLSSKRASIVLAFVSLLCCRIHVCVAQTEKQPCKEEIACKLESRAMPLLEDDATALKQVIFLLADAMSHRPTLPIEISLRAGLELYRKPLQVFDEKAYQVFAISDKGNWLALGASDGTVVLFAATKSQDLPWRGKNSWVPYTRPIISLLFDPNDRYLAVGYEDGTVKIIDLEKMAETGPGIKHRTIIRALVFSHDGRFLATLSHDDVIPVIECATSRKVKEISKFNNFINIEFSLDDSSIVTAGLDGYLRTFPLKKPLPPIKIPLGFQLRCAAFSPDAAWVAVCAEGHRLAFVRVKDGKRVHEIFDRNHLNAAAFDQFSNFVAAGSTDGVFHLFKLKSKEELVHIKSAGSVTAVAFSSDTRWIAVAREDGAVRVLEAGTGEEAGRVSHSRPVTALAFSADSKELITGSDDGKVMVSPVISTSEKLRIRRDNITAVALGKDNIALAAGQGIEVFDIRDGTSWKAPYTPRIDDIAFDDAGQTFVIASDQDARAYNSSRPDFRSPIAPIRIPDRSTEGTISAIAISQGAGLIAIGDMKGKVRTYSTTLAGEDPFKPIKSDKSNATIQAIAISASGQYLALSRKDLTFHIYESRKGDGAGIWAELNFPDLSCGGAITKMRFSSDSKRLVVSCSKGLVEICDIAEQTIMRKMKLKGDVAALEFDKDGHVFVGTDEGLIHIMNIATGDETGRITNPEKQIEEIAFDPDTKSLTCLSIGHSSDLKQEFVAVRQFLATANGLVRKLCSQIRYPIEREWSEYNTEEKYHNFCAAVNSRE